MNLDKEPEAMLHPMMASWVQGFLFGSAIESSVEAKVQGKTPRLVPSDLPDADALEGWVDKYCADHPLDTVGVASASLVYELVHRKSSAGPEPEG
jgi:hypothetical protein